MNSGNVDWAKIIALIVVVVCGVAIIAFIVKEAKQRKAAKPKGKIGFGLRDPEPIV